MKSADSVHFHEKFYSPINLKERYLFPQVVIIEEIRVLRDYKTLRSINKATYANHVLISNLAVADLLMGGYLLTVATVDTTLSGVYCGRSSEWLHGFTCKTLSTTVIMANLASVFTLVLLVAFFVVSVREVSVSAAQL